jgi:predicted nucleotidyltransferase component of viral defense system
MAGENETEALMLEILHLFADRFEEHAVLKGGLELRLVDCPRYTNDLDYVFVPYHSKRDIHKSVVSALEGLAGAVVESSAHSTCLRCLVKKDNAQVQVELNVAMDCPSEPLSTASLARAHNKLPRIIRAMRFDIALAHKIAAWNERRLIRDLYDAAFLSQVLGVSPEIATLRMRLENTPRSPKTGKPGVAKTVADLRKQIVSAASALTPESVEEELRYAFSPEEMAGLDKKIRTGIMGLVDKISD